MPLNKTINIILDQMYRLKLLKTNLKKRTMNNLLIDSSCTTTAFSYHNIFHRQCYGVSMGSSLAPVLVNIILTEIWKSGCNASH